MSNDVNSYVCDSHFADLDVTIKCYGRISMVYLKCSELSIIDFEYLGLKNRILKLFFHGSDQVLKELPGLKVLIKILSFEVDGLKYILNYDRSNNSIIDEIN